MAELSYEEHIKVVKDYLDNKEFALALREARAVTLLFPENALGYLLVIKSLTNNFETPLGGKVKKEHLGKLYSELSLGEVSQKEDEIIPLLKVANKFISSEEERELAIKVREYISIERGYNALEKKMASSYQSIKKLQEEEKNNSAQMENDKKLRPSMYLPFIITSILAFMNIVVFVVLAIVKKNASFMIPVYFTILPFIGLLLTAIYLMLLSKNTKNMYQEREESLIKRIAGIRNVLINFYISNNIDESLVEKIINSKKE